MSNAMTLEEWLIDEIAMARREARESHKMSKNSYGAGYDRGYCDALTMVLDKMNPEESSRRVTP